MLGAGACAISFVAGLMVASVDKTSSRPGDGPPGEHEALRVVLPETMTIQLRGLVSDRESCLQWVSSHFESLTVGQIAMMCGAGTH